MIDKYLATIQKNKALHNSYFDESLKQYLLLQLRFLAVCIGTLGIAYPWAVCIKYRATYHHTVVCGKRLKFIGCPKDLAAHWIWWWFLSIITVGIYSIVVHIKMKQWFTANLVFEVDNATTH